MMQKMYTKQNGFALIFTVLIITLVFSIAIGISNITVKQTILASLAKDSQVAFYEADAGVECGMYYDYGTTTFARGTDASTAPSSLTCGNAKLYLVTSGGTSYTDHLVYSEDQSNNLTPCTQIIFDKTDPAKSVVEGHGFNFCSSHPRQVERALVVTY